MDLQSVFNAGIETLFTVLKSAVHQAVYITMDDNGFDPIVETSHENVRLIFDNYKQGDMNPPSFVKLIQPTDTLGIVPSKDLPEVVNANNIMDVEGRRFTIVAFDTDPLNVAYIFLLRDIK